MACLIHATAYKRVQQLPYLLLAEHGEDLLQQVAVVLPQQAEVLTDLETSLYQLIKRIPTRSSQWELYIFFFGIEQPAEFMVRTSY